jgi:hypothetical protein
MAAARACDVAPSEWRIDLFDEPPSEADVVVAGPDADIPGAVDFDPADPAGLLEAIGNAARRGTRVVAVTGAGGGTGATTVALHLAARFALNRPTCFLDFDLRWGAGSRLGLVSGHRTWEQFDGTPESLRLSALPVPGGFRALVSPGARPVDATAAASLLDAVAADFDCVVVDSCPELLDVVLERAAAAIAVVSCTPVSAARARMLTAAHPRPPWAIVANRTGPGGETMRAGLARIVGRPITLELPCAPALRDAEEEGRLLGSGRSRWSARIDRLAGAIDRTLAAW